MWNKGAGEGDCAEEVRGELGEPAVVARWTSDGSMVEVRVK